MEGPSLKGWAVRPLKWHASWVQNVVRQFGLYLSWAQDICAVLTLVREDRVGQTSGLPVVPLRAVTDHDVDRMQVYRWRHHSRALLIARTFCVRVMHVDGCPDSGCVFCIVMPCFFPVCLADAFQVMIARRFHLFPSRTEKLSFVTPMVLPFGGRVGSRRFTYSCRGPVTNSGRAPFFCGCV